MLRLYIVSCILIVILYIILRKDDKEYLDINIGRGTDTMITPSTPSASTSMSSLHTPTPTQTPTHLTITSANNATLNKQQHSTIHDLSSIPVSQQSDLIDLPPDIVDKLLQQMRDMIEIKKKNASNFEAKSILESRGFSVQSYRDTSFVPLRFDGRDVWVDFLAPVQDQGTCSNNWAYVSLDVLHDRFAIMSLNKINTIFSVASITACSWDLDFLTPDLLKYWDNIALRQKLAQLFEVIIREESGCSSRSVYETIRYLYAFGAVSESCMPLTTSDYDIQKAIIPSCTDSHGLDIDMCLDGKSAMRIYTIRDAYRVNSEIRMIKAEIFKWGPVLAQMTLYSDFIAFGAGNAGKGMVYPGTDGKSAAIGYLIIRIVGWGKSSDDNSDGVNNGNGTSNGVNGNGTSNGVDINSSSSSPDTSNISNDPGYWIASASYGTNWGLNGYFKILINANCDVENNIIGIIPDIYGMKIPKEPSTFISEKDQYLKNMPFRHIDPVTGYADTALAKIRDGKLYGGLTPLNDTSGLPNYSKFYAGKIGQEENDVSEETGEKIYFGSSQVKPNTASGSRVGRAPVAGSNVFRSIYQQTSYPSYPITNSSYNQAPSSGTLNNSNTPSNSPLYNYNFVI